MSSDTSTGLALVGLTAVRVPIHATAEPCGQGESRIALHGLPEAATRESAVRIRSSLPIGYSITVTIEGLPAGASAAALDLAIAAAALRACGASVADHGPIVGEIDLSGRVRAVRGALALAEGGAAVLPLGNAAEVRPWLGVRYAETVADIYADLPVLQPTGLGGVRREHHDPFPAEPRIAELADACLATPSGRALLVGPPGSGKTAVARAALWAVAPMSAVDAADVTRIHGACGIANGAVWDRPFRAPHHSVSEAGLVGGGMSPRPGEVSLAHRGVLLLDDLPEFHRSALESVARALRAGEVTIARSRAVCRFPARPVLVVATANPCPCGYYGSRRECRCPEPARKRWNDRLAALSEFLDLPRLEVPAVSS